MILFKETGKDRATQFQDSSKIFFSGGQTEIHHRLHLIYYSLLIKSTYGSLLLCYSRFTNFQNYKIHRSLT